MENAVDKKVLAKRSRTLPMLIFVIGTSLLGGAVFYTTQLPATRERAFICTSEAIKNRLSRFRTPISPIAA